MLKILEDSKNPFIGQLFRELRSPELQNDRHRFRANLRMLGTLIAYEAAPLLGAATTEVKTPLGTRALTTIAEPPVLCAILRAALPFWEGMLEIYRDADSMIIGAARREGASPTKSLEMPIDLTYRALPRAGGRDWIIVDPMLATGSTLLGTLKVLSSHGLEPRRLIIAAAIAYRGAIDRMAAALKNVDFVIGAVDEELNELGYIVPGLGDAGDLCYGEKV